jgi:hypothetical protein
MAFSLPSPPAKSDGRFTVEIPIRWSATDERIAFARLRTAQRISNAVLAEYHRHVAAYHRDPELRQLRAESREAKREGRAKTTITAKHPAHKQGKMGCPQCKPVPAHVTPRAFEFATQAQRSAAWRAVRERHGSIGESKVDSLTPAGGVMYEQAKSFVKSITAKQSLLGARGLDGTTVTHGICDPQRDRMLEYVGAKTRKGPKHGPPRFASRRHPVTSVTGSSSAKNTGGLTVDVEALTFTWKAAREIRTGKNGQSHPAGPLQFPITARLRLPKHDPWLAKALRLPITQVRVLHRMLRGRRRWYVQLVVVGQPPVRPQLRAAIGARPTGAVGVDVGSRHIAAVGADRRKKDRWYRRLQRRVSLKRARFNGPDFVKKRAKTLTKTRDGKAVGKSVEVPAGFKKDVRIATSARITELNARLTESARADTRRARSRRSFGSARNSSAQTSSM